MNKNYFLVLPFVFLLFCAPRSDQNEELGEFAPPDAYLEGSKHPYYGSENPWDRRFFYDQIKFEYKRRGQRQMLDIVEDRPQETIKYCQELLAEDPNDLESLFNLAVAQTHIGDINSAIQAMERAVKAGIPFERFLAGPRDILKPLTESPEFKKIAAEHQVQLLHGPMLGCVTENIAKFWVRTLSEVPVYIEVSPSPDFSKSKMSKIYLTQSDRDFTTIVEINDLWPSTTYYYDIIVDGKPSLKPDYPTFKTYPHSGDSTRFQVGFGGGGGYYPPNERIWDLIQSYQLSAMLLMGDNVYINMPEMPNGVHYYTYYRRQSRPEFRRMVATTPIYAIWDDHDCATDDVWMGSFRDKPEWKMPLFQIFRENWNNPGYGDPEWPACWFSFAIGDVDFFMLDGRFYRTNPFEENPTMLGPIQKEWLLKELKKSKGTFKVIASPVPWSLATKGEARDTWNGFKAERQEIFNFLAENQINGVILLSADRHRSDAWRIDREDGYPLYEFESSRLTNQHVHELMPTALFGYNEKQSFGLLTFDTTLPDPTVMYQIVSIDNEVIHSLTLKKSEISH